MPKKQQRQKWHHNLPGPVGFGVETVRRGLVETFCHLDLPDSTIHKWGTGFFIGTDKYDNPAFVMTATCNCGHLSQTTIPQRRPRSAQTVTVWQGRRWASAQPVYTEMYGLALLRLNSPWRFNCPERPVTILQLTERRMAWNPDEAFMIGYYRPFYEYHPRLSWGWPSYLRHERVSIGYCVAPGLDRPLTTPYRSGMPGSPVLWHHGLLGAAAGIENGKMSIYGYQDFKAFLDRAFSAAETIDDDAVGDVDEYEGIGAHAKEVDPTLPEL